MLRVLVRHGRDLLVGLGLTAALFALAEGGLLLLGVEPDPAPELARGFEPERAYLVPEPGAAGGLRTALGHPRLPEFSIPAKGSAPRVVIVGGSNARGFNEALLARRLRAAGEREFEVLNLGVPGYGSERVRILGLQVLEQLAPDVLVVYSGHNEFVEASFRLDIAAAGARTLRARAREELRGTRVGKLLTRAVVSAEKRHASARSWELEQAKFADIDYAATLRALDAYALNIETLCVAARARGVRVLLCAPVYNRFAAPHASNLPSGLDADARRRFHALQARVHECLPAVLGRLAPRSDRDRVHSFDFGLVGETLPDGARQPALPGLRAQSGFLADAPQRWPDERPWAPKVRALYADLAELHAGPADAAQRDAALRAGSLLDEALALAPDHPRSLFVRALVAWYVGERGAETRALFEDAARYDRAPRKTNPAVLERVRALAARVDVVLHDSDAAFAGCHPDGLVGWEWMSDHCHLSGSGSAALMGELARTIVATWYPEPPR